VHRHREERVEVPFAVGAILTLKSEWP